MKPLTKDDTQNTKPAACRVRRPATDWRLADRIDLVWADNAPTLLVWTDDGEALRYQLTPTETYHLIRRLVGFLGYLHDRPETP